MGDSEKPFACPSPGCNMSFTNEDHLVVHKKKHDMVLNFGSNGKNTFVADQTPTPTRFIRNCEEVGLFQDLQNVNPFEETFRRAVEDGKTGALSESEGGGSDDTLHTPHIFPNMTESSAIVVVSSRPKETDLVPNEDENHSINDEQSHSEELKRHEIIVDSEKSLECSSNRIVVQEADTSVAPKIIQTTRASTNLSINGQEVQLLLKTADGKMMQLSAVPMSENRNENYRIEGMKPRNVLAQGDEASLKKLSLDDSGSRLSLAKMVDYSRLKQALTRSGSASPATSKDLTEDVGRSRSHEKISANTDQRKKQDVLARNRASSSRARAKRKAWIQQLQRSAGNANEKNASLQLEVKALRFEVAKLRAQLLAHENCPVTRAMEKGSLVQVQTKNPSIVQSVVQSMNTDHSTAVSARRKRTPISGETPIAPKVMKLSTSHQVILPKIDVIKRDYVVNDLSSLKIVDVRTIPRKRDASKSIVLVENPPRLELVGTSAHQMIQLNPTSLQIDNAASKCTGT